MKVVMVYNPKSGSALTLQELRTKCKSAGIEIESSVAIQNGFEKELASYVKKNKIIAVYGGDGTISAVAGMVAHSGAILAPLPGGTMNHFTKDLGISQNIDEVLLSLQKAHVRYVDIASVGEKFFINNSSLGLYPVSLRSRKKIESRFGKWLATILASLHSLITFKKYSISIEGEKAIVTPFVFIGNNRYSFSALKGISRSSLNEGVISVFVAKTHSRLKLFQILLMAVVGKSATTNDFKQQHTQALTIHTSRAELSVSYDGEVSKFTPPLEYKIHPKSLRILG